MRQSKAIKIKMTITSQMEAQTPATTEVMAEQHPKGSFLAKVDLKWTERPW